MAANAGRVAFPTFRLPLKCRPPLCAKTSALGLPTAGNCRKNTERSLPCHGWQGIDSYRAGNFLATVDDVIVVTGKSGPTTKRRSASAEVHDYQPQTLSFSLPRQRIGFFRATALDRFGDSQGVRGENA
jgi:hypothetical protein